MALLVALTLAARVSELQALDPRPLLLCCTRGRTVLRLNPTFLPKVPPPELLNGAVVFQAFTLILSLLMKKFIDFPVQSTLCVGILLNPSISGSLLSYFDSC